MAIPTSYSEETLKAFMLAALSNLGATLGLTAASFDEAVNDTLLAYGVSDIAQATDMAKLRGLAKVAAWQVAVAASAGDYDFSADGGNYRRSQLHEQARKGLAAAEADAALYGGDNQASIGVMAWGDPYRPVEGA